MSTRLSNTSRLSLGPMLLGALVTLTACGGGGSGDSPFVDRPETDLPDTTPAPPTGEEMEPVTEAEPPEQGSPDAPPSEDEGSCSVADQNEWVYDSMRDYYLFYDQVPVVDPGDFDSPEALLDEIRFEERDRFSFITSAEGSDLAFEEGREFGLGYRWGRDFDDSARIISVMPDSPFGRAGIERGDVIVEINGSPVYDVFGDDERFDTEVFGAPDAPVESEWTFVRGDDGETFTERFVSTEYALDTVQEEGVYTVPAYDGAVGYFLFDRFLETSTAELEATFDRFREEGVTDVVLDLRYNGGGRISVAEELSSLMLDDSQDGALLQRYVYNDKYQDENFELLIGDELAGLGLRTLVVLVTGSTASSSEIIAGGLRPLMDVRVVGDARTAGKPFIQSGRDRCGERLNAIEAEAFDADGDSVFGGIAPDCYAYDDWMQGFGENEETGEIEGMLLAGLDLLLTGACEPFVEDGSRSRDARGPDTSGQGTTPIGGAIRD